MDRIVIEGLEVWAYHGVLAHEREHGQRFVVDAALQLDLEPAGASDDLADTLDYGRLAEQIRASAGGGPHQLIETVAQRVADACLDDPRVAAVEVAVHKPDAPLRVPVRSVRVELRRQRPTP